MAFSIKFLSDPEEIPSYKPDNLAVVASNFIFFVVLFIFAVFET